MGNLPPAESLDVCEDLHEKQQTGSIQPGVGDVGTMFSKAINHIVQVEHFIILFL